MSDSGQVELEWLYTPNNYSESPFHLESDTYVLRGNSGLVQAFMSTTDFDANPSVRNSIEERIRGYLRGIQLYRHQEFKLTRGALIRIVC